MVPDRPGALAAIGDTPIARLSRVVDAGMAEVWVKLEASNPTAAALAVARRLGEGARVATIQVDSGLKYLAGELYS